MSEEAAVVNMFLTVRVGLVGGLLLFLPRITRKGLVFGTYVGESVAEGEAVRVLLRSWNISCVLLMALSLAVGLGISAAGWPVPGNLTGTAVLLLCAPLLYFRMYLRARHLAPPVARQQGRQAAAVLSVDVPEGEDFAKFALAVCLLGAIATIGYAAVNYEALPEQWRPISNLFGLTEELSQKSWASVLFFPLVTLVLGPAFALFGLLITRAKRSVRGGSGGRSAQAQDAFRVTVSHLFSGTAVFTSLFLSYLSVQMIRVGLAQTDSLGAAGLMVVSVPIILYALFGLISIIRILGQGGALLEEGSEEAPLTGGLADNSHWFWGLIYFDRDDPSILVESRFGIGYTMNYGNRRALLYLGIYLALILGLIVLGFSGGVT